MADSRAGFGTKARMKRLAQQAGVTGGAHFAGHQEKYDNDGVIIEN